MRAIVQTAAVLGLTHRLIGLSNNDASWIPPGESLVASEDLIDFFMKAGRVLYSKKAGVMPAALKELGGAVCAEVSMVRGLMLWLAWETDMQVHGVLACEELEDIEINLRGLARLLQMAPDLVDDTEAYSRALEAIRDRWSNYYFDEFDPIWIDEFMEWAGNITDLQSNPGRSSAVTRNPAMGDIVFNARSRSPDFFVVMESAQNRLRLIDFESANELKPYASDYFAVAVAGDS